MADVTIRPATADDSELLYRLVRELAEFENEPDAVHASPEDFRRHGFGPDPAFRALIAELDGAPAGFALYFRNFSTWTGRPGLYLEDLFVRQSARGHGIGGTLVAHVAAEAVRMDGGRVDLWVLHWNPARKFYEKLGLAHMEDWLPYRVDGDRLRRLAELA